MGYPALSAIPGGPPVYTQDGQHGEAMVDHGPGPSRQTDAVGAASSRIRFYGRALQRRQQRITRHTLPQPRLGRSIPTRPESSPAADHTTEHAADRHLGPAGSRGTTSASRTFRPGPTTLDRTFTTPAQPQMGVLRWIPLPYHWRGYQKPAGPHITPTAGHSCLPRPPRCGRNRARGPQPLLLAQHNNRHPSTYAPARSASNAKQTPNNERQNSGHGLLNIHGKSYP